MDKVLPKIGVIIPAYLETDMHMDYLKQSVDSVTRQTYLGDIETIVIVNGRGGGCKNELPDLKGTVVSFEYKLSAAVARNIGAVMLSQKDCKYLCFLDADDVWLSNKIEQQINYMAKTDVDFSFTQAFCIDSLGKRIGDYPQPRDGFYNEEIKKILPVTNMLINSTVMVKTTSFLRAGMYPATNEFSISHSSHLNNKGNICEDYLLWFNSINKGFKFGKINEKLIEYRLNSSVER